MRVIALPSTVVTPSILFQSLVLNTGRRARPPGADFAGKSRSIVNLGKYPSEKPLKSVGIWQIAEHRPQRLTGSRVELEKHLEDWIENDPGLLEAGLTIVGRQNHCEAGPLDLLAVGPQGR